MAKRKAQCVVEASDLLDKIKRRGASELALRSARRELERWLRLPGFLKLTVNGLRRRRKPNETTDLH